jgi:MFS family permease
VKDRFLAKLRMPDGSINPWVIAVTVTLATFMEVLDTSIANVALPHISGNLSAGADESTWVLTSYLVSNAIVLPLSGWLSGLIGRKRGSGASALRKERTAACSLPAAGRPLLHNGKSNESFCKRVS